MPDSTLSLGLNASDMYSELKTAESTYTAGLNRMGKGTDALGNSHDRLLKSSSRVAGQFAHFFSIAAGGGNSMSLLATGIEAAAHAMHLSLGLTAVGYVGGLAIQKVADMREEWRKLNEELDRAAKPRDPNSTKPIEDDINERKDAIEKARKAKEESDKNPWMTGTNWIRNSAMAAGRGIKAGWSAFDDDYHPDNGPRVPRAESYAQALQNAPQHDTSWSTAFHDGSAPDKTWSNMRGSKSDDEIRAEKTRAAKEQTAVVELQKHTAEIELARAKRSETKKESMQLSLEDLAKNGREWAPGNDTRAGDGRLARMALKEEGLSRKEMLGGHWDEALQHRDRAEQIKNSIGTLKDSAKDMESVYQRGLDSSLILRSIDNKLGGITLKGQP